MKCVKLQFFPEPTAQQNSHIVSETKPDIGEKSPVPMPNLNVRIGVTSSDASTS